MKHLSLGQQFAAALLFVLGSQLTHAQGRMGPLRYGVNFNLGDIYFSQTDSPEQCAQICFRERRCIAMTYIINSQQCWIKNRLNPPTLTEGMVSSSRQRVAVAPAPP